MSGTLTHKAVPVSGLAPNRDALRTLNVPRRVAAALGVLILASVTLSLVAATIPALWGWQPRVVLSGSMEPAISAGDVVLVGPITRRELRPGLVILADAPAKPDHTYLHRVVSVGSDGVVTRGDANATNDTAALAPGAVRGQVRLVVPLVGWPMLWATERTSGMLAAAAASSAALVAAAVAVARLRRPPPKRRGRRRSSRRAG